MKKIVYVVSFCNIGYKMLRRSCVVFFPLCKSILLRSDIVVETSSTLPTWGGGGGYLMVLDQVNRKVL